MIGSCLRWETQNECNHDRRVGDVDFIRCPRTRCIELGGGRVCRRFGGRPSAGRCGECRRRRYPKGRDDAFPRRFGGRRGYCAFLCHARRICDGDYALRSAAANCRRHYPQNQRQSGAGQHSFGGEFCEMGLAAGFAGDGCDEPKRDSHPHCLYPHGDTAAFAGV